MLYVLPAELTKRLHVTGTNVFVPADSFYTAEWKSLLATCQ